MNKQIEGTFSVKLTPQKDEASPSNLGRMILDKEYQGGLKATGKGQMLTAMTTVDGSAGYVAVEQVAGTLEGRKGSFLMLHSGTMSAGNSQLSISIVPDSGTGELVGISGRMLIKIEEGQHYYIFDYAMP